MKKFLVIALLALSACDDPQALTPPASTVTADPDAPPKARDLDECPRAGKYPCN